MKKLIATLLALVMLFSCVSALAGSAGSLSGSTTRNAELAAFEDGNGYIYISGLGNAVNTTPAAKVISIDPYRILFLAKENAAASVPATRLIALALDTKAETIVSDDVLSAALLGDAVYYISAATPNKVVSHDLTTGNAVGVYQGSTNVDRLYATSDGIVLVTDGGANALVLADAGPMPYSREIAQEYAVYDSFDLFITAERGLVAVYDGESIAIDVNVAAWAVLNDQVFYLTENTGVLSLKSFAPATGLRSVVLPACQNMQRQLTASQNLLFMLSNDNVVHTVAPDTGRMQQYVTLPAMDTFQLPGGAVLEGYVIEAVSGQLNIIGKVRQQQAAPTFTFVQSAQQSVTSSASSYMLLTAYTVSGEDTVHMLLQPAAQYSLLQYGSRGDAVSAIQKVLLDLKYYDYIVDGIYGWRTRSAIEVLQADLGYPVTGAADAELQKLILSGKLSVYDPYRSLSKGDTGLRVQNMQQRLRDLGYLADSADGVFGARTQAAVILFQSEHNLRQNGVADANTLRTLYSETASACSVYIELTRGDSGYRVRELNQRLKDLYYLDVRVSDNYNSSTVAAVKKFQTVSGLRSSGIATTQVQKVLFGRNAKENPDLITLRRGDVNARVMMMQKRLNELGYNCGYADGEYGRNTERAVKTFQRFAGLEATGIATVETQRRLYAPDAPVYVEPTELGHPVITIDPYIGADGDIYLMNHTYGDIVVTWYTDGDVESYDIRITDDDGNVLMDEKGVVIDTLNLPVDIFSIDDVFTLSVTAHPTAVHTGGAKTSQLRFKRMVMEYIPPVGIDSLVIMPDGSYELDGDLVTFLADGDLLWIANGNVHGYTWQISDNSGNPLAGYGSGKISGTDRVTLTAADFQANEIYTLSVAAYTAPDDSAPVQATIRFTFDNMLGMIDMPITETDPIDTPVIDPIDTPVIEPIEEPVDEPFEEIITEPVDEIIDEPLPSPIDLYSNFYYSTCSGSPVVLADVTGDSAEEMIILVETENEVIGTVYTIRDGNVTPIHTINMLTFHGGGDCGWYLVPRGSDWSLVVETDNMWQGYGEASFMHYTLTPDGEMIQESSLWISDQQPDCVDGDGRLLDKTIAEFGDRLGEIISRGYVLYRSSSLCVLPIESVNMNADDTLYVGADVTGNGFAAFESNGIDSSELIESPTWGVDEPIIDEPIVEDSIDNTDFGELTDEPVVDVIEEITEPIIEEPIVEEPIFDAIEEIMEPIIEEPIIEDIVIDQIDALDGTDSSVPAEPYMIELLNKPYNKLTQMVDNLNWFDDPEYGGWIAEGLYQTQGSEVSVHFDFYEQPGDGVYPGSMAVFDYEGVRAPIYEGLYTGMTIDEMSSLWWFDTSCIMEDGMGGYVGDGYPEQGLYFALAFDGNGVLVSVSISYFE